MNINLNHQISWDKKWGIISDIHGNICAFNKCLEEMKTKDISNIFFLGDALGYMPHANEILHLLKLNNCICILGNHDAMALGILEVNKQKDEVYGISDIKKTLNKDEIEYLRSWPTHLKIQNPTTGVRLYFVHGSPHDPFGGYLYENNCQNELQTFDQDILFVGQTHRPFIKIEENFVIVNVGSCGLPRDIGKLGSYALYDPLDNKAQIERFEFDVDEVMKTANHLRKLHPSVINCLNRGMSSFQDE